MRFVRSIMATSGLLSVRAPCSWDDRNARCPALGPAFLAWVSRRLVPDNQCQPKFCPAPMQPYLFFDGAGFRARFLRFLFGSWAVVSSSVAGFSNLLGALGKRSAGEDTPDQRARRRPHGQSKPNRRAKRTWRSVTSCARQPASPPSAKKWQGGGAAAPSPAASFIPGHRAYSRVRQYHRKSESVTTYPPVQWLPESERRTISRSDRPR